MFKFYVKKKKFKKYYFYKTHQKIKTQNKFKKIFQFFHCDFLYLYYYNTYSKINLSTFLFNKIKIVIFLLKKTPLLLNVYRSIFKDGFYYLRALAFIAIIDATFTDDEPLWEPIEWSLVMTWILFIFVFAWIAENLITSRYGSYTSRDKRVWFGWFKTYWLLDAWFCLSYGTAATFVILPFYTELTYQLNFTFSWWNWYTRIFFYKFVNIYAVMLLIAFYIQINLKWWNWKKIIFFSSIIHIILSYLLYSHLIITFFAYFTDPLWYQKTKFIDYIQMSHEPWKWGWGPVKRDHFSYHKVSTIFWFKSDGAYASAFLLIHSFFFISLFLLYIYWLTLLRRIYSTREITITFYVYCVSALKQFFFLFFMFYLCISISLFLNYLRFPLEFFWLRNVYTWGDHFLNVASNYIQFLISMFK